MTTLKNVIKAGYLTAFPKFTTKQFRKFPPNSKATVAGHIHTTRGNKKRTTTTPTVANITIIEPDSIPSLSPKPAPTSPYLQPLPIARPDPYIGPTLIPPDDRLSSSQKADDCSNLLAPQ